MTRYIITNNGGEVTMTDPASDVTLSFVEGEPNTLKTVSLGTVGAKDYVAIAQAMTDHAYETGLLKPMDREDLVRQYYRQNIAEQLKALRKEKGLSVRDLAAMSGIGHSHIVRIEGARYAANLNTLGAIADALGMDIGFIDRSKDT